MKRILIFFLMSLCLFSANPRAGEFIAGFEDIPLMDGLSQNDADTFEFGNEETSYRETQLIASNKKSFANIASFYEKTLPQLGWNLVKKDSDKLTFERENGLLEISKTGKKPLKINISLKNKN